METEDGTGTGKVTVYPVFSGIELYYNDMHMAYCNKEQKTVYGTALFLTNKNRKTGQFFVEGKEREMDVEIKK